MAWKDPEFSTGDGGVVELPTFTPAASPFADAAARDAYFSANLDELYNGNNPDYSYTLIELESPAETERWSGDTNPAAYDNTLWITTTAGQLQSDWANTDQASAQFIANKPQRFKAITPFTFTNTNFVNDPTVDTQAVFLTFTPDRVADFEIFVTGSVQVLATNRSGNVGVYLDDVLVATVFESEMKDIDNVLNFAIRSDDISISAASHNLKVTFGNNLGATFVILSDVKATIQEVS